MKEYTQWPEHWKKYFSAEGVAKCDPTTFCILRRSKHFEIDRQVEHVLGCIGIVCSECPMNIKNWSSEEACEKIMESAMTHGFTFQEIQNVLKKR